MAADDDQLRGWRLIGRHQPHTDARQLPLERLRPDDECPVAREPTAGEEAPRRVGRGHDLLDAGRDSDRLQPCRLLRPRARRIVGQKEQTLIASAQDGDRLGRALNWDTTAPDDPVEVDDQRVVVEGSRVRHAHRWRTVVRLRTTRGGVFYAQRKFAAHSVLRAQQGKLTSLGFTS